MISKQKILIVDDDENIAELISLYSDRKVFRHKDRIQWRGCAVCL